MPFRLACQAALLTYPQCDKTKDSLLLNITLAQWPKPILWAVVSQEKHKDGSPHLHAIVRWEERIDIKDANPILDGLCGQHGDYKPVGKGVNKTIAYVVKDGDYVTHGPVPDWTAKINIQTETAKMLLEGKTYNDIVEAYPGYAMVQKRKLQDFEAYCSRKRAADALQVWIPPTTDSSDYNVQLIAEWLSTNIKKKRAPRQKQLFITGPPGVGKTRLIAQLSAFLRVYHIPKEEDYYDFWENGAYDLAVLDEFKHHKRIQWLNSWLDGSIMCLKIKGAQLMKNQNVPTIILSNFTMEEMYKDGVGRDALLQRLEIAFISSDFNLFPDLSTE